MSLLLLAIGGAAIGVASIALHSGGSSGKCSSCKYLDSDLWYDGKFCCSEPDYGSELTSQFGNKTRSSIDGEEKTIKELMKTKSICSLVKSGNYYEPGPSRS